MNDTDLVTRLATITDKSEDEIAEILKELSFKQIYKLIDFIEDDAKLLDVVNSLTSMEESMGKKHKVSGTVPKPRDPMAKSLALPQYQPKSTPTKKGKLEKLSNKHKGRGEPSLDASSPVKESAMSLTAIPAINRILELAGCHGVSPIQLKDTLPDFSKYGVDAVELGTSLPPGTIAFDHDGDDPAPKGSALDVVRSAAQTIKNELVNIKIREINDAKEIINELNSVIDQLRNGMSE